MARPIRRPTEVNVSSRTQTVNEHFYQMWHLSPCLHDSHCSDVTSACFDIFPYPNTTTTTTIVYLTANLTITLFCVLYCALCASNNHAQCASNNLAHYSSNKQTQCASNNHSIRALDNRATGASETLTLCL